MPHAESYSVAFVMSVIAAKWGRGNTSVLCLPPGFFIFFVFFCIVFDCSSNDPMQRNTYLSGEWLWFHADVGRGGVEEGIYLCFVLFCFVMRRIIIRMKSGGQG